MTCSFDVERSDVTIDGLRRLTLRILLGTLSVLLIGVSSFPIPRIPHRNVVPDLISPFDTFGNLCWEDERARLDNFAIHLQKLPETSIGYIFVAAGRASCIDEAKYRAKRAKDWVVKRGLHADRIVTKDSGFREDVTTVLWIMPKGTNGLESESELTKSQVSIHKCVDKVFARVLCPNQK